MKKFILFVEAGNIHKPRYTYRQVIYIFQLLNASFGYHMSFIFFWVRSGNFPANITNNANESITATKTCKCDDDCTMYGDCCFDRAKANIQNKDSIFRSTWQCKKFTSQVSNTLQLETYDHIKYLYY